MSLDPEVVITTMGAKAIRDKLTGELMHPVVGPLVESERLYVAPSRLRERLEEGDASEPFVLLDVGLGAGSNAIAAWRVSEALGASARRLHIVSFDQSLEAMKTAAEPEHAASFGFEGAAGEAAKTLLAQGVCETARTIWTMRQGDLWETLSAYKGAPASLVFWDPFSPGANPALWTMRAFAMLHPHCGEDVTVHTYGGATSTRAALLLAGFCVGEGIIVGDASKAGQKKRATVAAQRKESLERPLDARWLERIARSSAPFPSDAPEDALERIRGHRQFV
jgi:queuine tRNA-ribosyltransferase